MGVNCSAQLSPVAAQRPPQEGNREPPTSALGEAEAPKAHTLPSYPPPPASTSEDTDDEGGVSDMSLPACEFSTIVSVKQAKEEGKGHGSLRDDAMMILSRTSEPSTTSTAELLPPQHRFNRHQQRSSSSSSVKAASDASNSKGGGKGANNGLFSICSIEGDPSSRNSNITIHYQRGNQQYALQRAIAPLATNSSSTDPNVVGSPMLFSPAEHISRDSSVSFSSPNLLNEQQVPVAATIAPLMTPLTRNNQRISFNSPKVATTATTTTTTTPGLGAPRMSTPSQRYFSGANSRSGSSNASFIFSDDQWSVDQFTNPLQYTSLNASEMPFDVLPTH